MEFHKEVKVGQYYINKITNVAIKIIKIDDYVYPYRVEYIKETNPFDRVNWLSEREIKTKFNLAIGYDTPLWKVLNGN